MSWHELNAGAPFTEKFGTLRESDLVMSWEKDTDF